MMSATNEILLVIFLPFCMRKKRLTFSLPDDDDNIIIIYRLSRLLESEGVGDIRPLM